MTYLKQEPINSISNNADHALFANPLLGRGDGALAKEPQTALHDDGEQLCPVASGRLVQCASEQPVRLAVTQLHAHGLPANVEVVHFALV